MALYTKLTAAAGNCGQQSAQCAVGNVCGQQGYSEALVRCKSWMTYHTSQMVACSDHEQRVVDGRGTMAGLGRLVNIYDNWAASKVSEQCK